MQNIVYTLVTKGKRDLDHISYYARSMKQDRGLRWKLRILENETGDWIRIFNTHLLPSMMPKVTQIQKLFMS